MTYQFKVGDRGKTRDGRDYRVLVVDLKNVAPVAAAITDSDGTEYVTMRYADGQNLKSGKAHLGDLTPPNPVAYINVYEREDGLRFAGWPQRTPERAADEVSLFVDKRVGCLRVPLEARFDE